MTQFIQKLKRIKWGKRLKRIIKKENSPKFTLNMIRHSWAKRAIKSKFSSADCAISMGCSITEFQAKYLNSVKIKDITDT